MGRIVRFAAEMKLIVGLGNPGAEYERTRHNVGWQVVEAFARKFRIAIAKHEKSALTGTGAGGGRERARGQAAHVHESVRRCGAALGERVPRVDDGADGRL